MVTMITASACSPKLNTPKHAAGSRDIMTYNIMRDVVSFDLICGLEDTFNKSLTSICLLFLLFICKYYLTHRLDGLCKLSLSRTDITTAAALTTFQTIVRFKAFCIPMLRTDSQFSRYDSARAYLYTSATIDVADV